MSVDVDTRGLLAALRQVGSIIAFALAPAAVVAGVLVSSWAGDHYLYDFHGDIYDAGRAILHGHDPYRAAFLDHIAAVVRAGGRASTTFAVPVYPAPALLAGAPLALLSLHLAGAVFTVLSVLALALGLRLLGVTDWRCYGAAFLSWPVVHSLRLGQVNELLLLGTAVAWRWRERMWPPALAVAGVVLLKLLLWPLGVWLVITRRLRTAALAVGIAVVVGILAWAVIGFDGLSAYPRMLGDLSAVEGGAGVSPASLGRALGISRSVAEALGWVVAVGLFGLARGRDRQTISVAVIAALFVSPLVWPHYLTLVFAPIALASPTLSPLWLLPLLTYLAPVELTHGDGWQIGLYLAIELAVALWVVSSRGRAAGLWPAQR
jgi:hypothetical protein